MRTVYIENNISYEIIVCEDTLSMTARLLDSPQGNNIDIMHTEVFTSKEGYISKNTLAQMGKECSLQILRKKRLAESLYLVNHERKTGFFELSLKQNNGVLKVIKKTDDIAPISFRAYNQCLLDINEHHSYSNDGVYFYLQSEADKTSQLFCSADIQIYEVADLNESVKNAKERLLMAENDFKKDSIYLRNKREYDCDLMDWESEF